ncbi:type II toxin-antitoxin system antitoxin DNA ADP-ribosyl glycohydrolase DarG [Sphingobacterium bambusae]|uniref:Macro domain-containing protein n=1 Tax=Sphingobacterium bambusae TaxID=662858 RepID=A0ABW6BF57_9SPHI|nr:macro domain-containing protein [Sphingobacterium bambusae]WPL48744.1 macro domain-containing protein [Sphingobacterium bambusae]
MIRYVTGNILDSKAQALVNTVNTMGVMGKGVALQFKKAYPNNYKAYEKACKLGKVEVGKMFITKDSNTVSGDKLIINFPTKTSWKKPSEYRYIEDGLDSLIGEIEAREIKSIAIPPLGAGNGGLNWEKVKNLIEEKLQRSGADIYVYEPTLHIQEQLKKERVKLTDARALLLYVLYDLVKNGEYVSEFSAEKICYFLQKFGARKYFKLTFEPNFYGPYSGKVRFVLNAINGSYLMGYSDMDKKPFEPLTLVSDAYEDVKNHVESNTELVAIANKTIIFLRGFYSDFALELLSSMDYIATKEKTLDRQVISNGLEKWNNRKRSLFSNPKYFEVSLRHLEKNLSQTMS